MFKVVRDVENVALEGDVRDRREVTVVLEVEFDSRSRQFDGLAKCVDSYRE
jgi:hypothetical protein